MTAESYGGLIWRSKALRGNLSPPGVAPSSEKTSQNSPNHTTINWRQIRDFCSKGARVALDRLQRGVLGGLKQEERKEREQRNNCHGRPQCTHCKRKKSGFRLKLRIKKLSLRTIWRKSQKGFSYLWLNWNLKTVHLDWLQAQLALKRALSLSQLLRKSV